MSLGNILGKHSLCAVPMIVTAIKIFPITILGFGLALAVLFLGLLVVGTPASTRSRYGYYADGSTLSIFSRWTTRINLGIGSTVVASYSGYWQSIPKSAGTKYWYYQGGL